MNSSANSNTRIVRMNGNVINIFTDKNIISLHNNWCCDIVIYSEGEEEGEIEKREYSSGEHCFQGEKYYRLSVICNDENRKKNIYEYSKKFLKDKKKGLAEIKKLSGKKGFRLTNLEIKMWNIIAVRIQREICRYKINNYKRVFTELLYLKKFNDHKHLIYLDINNSFKKTNNKYNFKLDNKILEGCGVILESGEIYIEGQNLLGKIWTDYKNSI